jgi:hypothetical protein
MAPARLENGLVHADQGHDLVRIQSSSETRIDRSAARFFRCTLSGRNGLLLARFRLFSYNAPLKAIPAQE